MSPTRILAALSLFATGAAIANAADESSLKLPRSAPEEQGISSSALLGFVQEAEQKIDALHSLILVRHGHVVAEGWWSPYAADEPHSLYSLSKSFTSTAVGLAAGRARSGARDTPLVAIRDLRQFEQVVCGAFTYRRKTLANSLALALDLPS